MASQQVEALIARWMEDKAFRDRMRSAPVQTAQEEGFGLDDEEQRALAALDLNQSDDELAGMANFA
jgi:hypothetical protein